MSEGTGTHGVQLAVRFGERSGGELTDHMFEVDREVDNLIAKKRRQADRMPTLLLMDFSRTGWSWVRPGSVWTPVLRSKLEGEPYAGLGLMVSTLDRSLPLQLHMVLGPSVPPELHVTLDRVAEHFNLASEQ